jgi:hypothetical protein
VARASKSSSAHIANCAKADAAYGAGVAKALGLELHALAAE